MSHLKFALKKARSHDYDGFVQFYLCAVITRGGKVVSVGFNRSVTEDETNLMHPNVRWAITTARKDTNNYNVHAEMDAIERLPVGVDLPGCKMHVARIRSPDDEPALARPCSVCENLLYRFGIRRINYTFDRKTYGIMSIKKSGLTQDRLYARSL